MRTGAVRSNLVESATRMTCRALAMIACATLTSRKVEIEQRAVGIDGGGADHGIVDLELADEIDGRLADNAAVGLPRTTPPAITTSILSDRVATCWQH